MIHIIIDCLDQEEGDLIAYGRVLRGLEGLEKSGYSVDRFDYYHPKGEASHKKAIIIQQTDKLDNTEYEAWLRSQRQKYISNSNSSYEKT